VKSIITIATAGTSGQNTRKRSDSPFIDSPYRQVGDKTKAVAKSGGILSDQSAVVQLIGRNWTAL
jgi:hypothetical protein